ncbi:MAG TPA: peptide ABC transporter substrate-binding protein [Thermomicrobiaceae bacterium]|nr:peptide ABC transporter substrate-binding protein [Thermomicrobiaceae bacterium]
MDTRKNEFARLVAAARTHRLSRRALLRRAALAGLGAPAIAALLAACGPATTGTTAVTGGAPAGSAGSGVATSAATSARGHAGPLRLLWWEAPTILNPHLAPGTTDFDAARVVLEPLADFDVDGNLVPILAAEVPTAANGGLAADGKSVTWTLRPGVTWSDGQPFTARDVAFTYEYVSNPATAATTIGAYLDVAGVDIVDPQTVRVRFRSPSPGWFSAFCGTNGMILPAHVLQGFVGANSRNARFNLAPIGTGAFTVDSFVPGDSAHYSVNDRFREPDRPSFATVDLKGGGDATSAARAVIQLGEVDYAWNLRVPAPVLTAMVTPGSPGKLVVYPGSGVERILINLTDPNQTVDGERSHLGTPHPFQSILAVRQAYALAVDRGLMATRLYGPGGSATANVLVAPSAFVSKNTSWTYDPAAAGALLDQTGWAVGANGIRSRHGVPMTVTFQATVDQLHQQEQELVQSSFAQLGVHVTLKTIDAGVFFSSDPANADTAAHFYADLEMFTNGPTTPYPIDYMRSWYGAASNIAQRSNQWSGLNLERWQSSAYDAAYEQAKTELDPTTQARLFVSMNDLVVNDVVDIAEVARNGVSGAARTLRNLELSPWTSELWNLANWTRAS